MNLTGSSQWTAPPHLIRQAIERTQLEQRRPGAIFNAIAKNGKGGFRHEEVSRLAARRLATLHTLLSRGRM